MKQTKTYRYLAMGDSYTIGEKVKPHQNWPNQLVKQLVAAGFDISQANIIAKTGWTTRDLLVTLDHRDLSSPFDLVTLLIGVNNQYQNLDLEDYRTEFDLLLHKAIEYSAGDPARVIVLSIPDWSVTPFAASRNRSAIRAQIDRFNQVNRLATRLVESPYLDITPISRRAETDPTLLCEDRLHPSENMYAQWVNLIFPTAYQILCKNLKERLGNESDLH